jgi:hypothetical protein
MGARNEFRFRCDWGVDSAIKTLYSPPSVASIPLQRAPIFQGFIVKSRNVVRTSRPLKGLVAFVHAAAMNSAAGCTNALHPGLPVSYRRLDRSEDQVHPGEGAA